MGGAGADIIYLPGAGAEKISGTGAEEKWLGSATLDIDITTGKGERKLKGKGKRERRE